MKKSNKVFSILTMIFSLSLLVPFFIDFSGYAIDGDIIHSVELFGDYSSIIALYGANYFAYWLVTVFKILLFVAIGISILYAIFTIMQIANPKKFKFTCIRKIFGLLDLILTILTLATFLTYVGVFTYNTFMNGSFVCGMAGDIGAYVMLCGLALITFLSFTSTATARKNIKK